MNRLFRLTKILTCITILCLAFTATAQAELGDSANLLKIRKIDKSDYPNVHVYLGLTTKKKAVDFKVIENGRKLKDVKVSSSVSKQPVSVTLVIDASGSMKGEPLVDAKAAAMLFVERAREDDQIAVVAFNSQVSRVADFTNDKAKIIKALDSLTATGETAVYDALIESLIAAQKQAGDQNIILLTDGGDTASKNQEASAAKLAGDLKIPVSAIALESAEFNPAPIADIANRSGGQLVTVPASEVLQSMYDGLAAELHNRYQLSFKSLTKTDEARIKVKTTVGDQQLLATAIMTGLVRKTPVKPVKPAKPQLDKNATKLADMSSPWLAALMIFLAIFLLTVALAQLFQPSKNTLKEQLKYYDQLTGKRTSEGEQSTLGDAHQRLVDIAGQVSAKYDFSNYAQTKLERAGLPVKPNEYMTMHLLAIIGISLASQLLTGNTFLTLVLIVLSAALPLAVVQLIIFRRRAQFSRQLPETLDMIASSMRAGHGLQQAVFTTGRETREPTASELARVANQAQMGMSLDEALQRMADRVGDKSFKWVILAISIHRETGGNLAEILDTLAETLRQREVMRRQISGLTAEGRLSAIILMILPVVESLLLIYVNPGYMSALYTTVPGILLLLFAITLMALGGLWFRKITNIEY